MVLVALLIYEFLKLIHDAKASGTKPKYEGYDAFDYNKESEYAASKAEQERRLSDLQTRLNSAYDKSTDECEKLLKGAGYAAKDVTNALKDLGGDLGNDAEKGLKSIGNKIGL
mgnify:CR=1 FL=1